MGHTTGQMLTSITRGDTHIRHYRTYGCASPINLIIHSVGYEVRCMKCNQLMFRHAAGEYCVYLELGRDEWSDMLEAMWL